MKIVVCEDDVYERKMIREAISETLRNFSLEIAADYFPSGEQLLYAMKQENRYCLYLLDIMLGKEENGIKLAEEIRKHDSEAQIAFLTNSSEYAIDAFEVGVIHYIIKPVTAEKVRSVLERWRVLAEQQESCLEVQSGKETRKFVKSQVLYIRSRDRGIEIHMKVHKWDSWMKYPFGAIEKELKAMPQFVKIKRGYIVNLDNVRRIDSSECILTNGEMISVSRREQTEVMNKYNDYLFYKMELDEKRGAYGG